MQIHLYENEENNYSLSKLLHSNLLSSLPLNSAQIDYYNTILNWSIISRKPLDGWLFYKYAHLLDWKIFLTNGHPKELKYLILCKKYILPYSKLFESPRLRKAYYVSDFVCALPELVNFRWYVENCIVEDFVLDLFWRKFPIQLILKYQKPSRQLISRHVNEIDWNLFSQIKIPTYYIEDFANHLNWQSISRYQKLDENFIDKYFNKLDLRLVARYQELSQTYILKNQYWLNAKIYSKYQKFTMEFLQEHSNILDLEELTKNVHYNKVNTIQCIKLHDQYYIIDAPTINQKSKILFCSTVGGDPF